VSHKRLSREVREPQMLDAAVAAFAEHGFHDASMDDIAARADVSKPMIYAYLGSKEELFVTCIHREGTRLMEAIVDVVDPMLTPDDQMWSGMRAFFAFVADNVDSWTVLHRQAPAAFADEYAAMRARMVDVVDGMLHRAVQGRGGASQPDEIATLAFALVGAGESLADWLADNPTMSPDALANRFMRIIWLGVGSLLDGAAWHPLPKPPANAQAHPS
jgi:AcrR family transcriptional regulator